VFAPGHLGELTRLIPFEMVDEILVATRRVQRRVRLLPARARPHRGSFTIALKTGSNQITPAAGVIANTVIDVIGRVVLDHLLPDRRVRVKAAGSNARTANTRPAAVVGWDADLPCSIYPDWMAAR
jgi:hypothetical protein